MPIATIDRRDTKSPPRSRASISGSSTSGGRTSPSGPDAGAASIPPPAPPGSWGSLDPLLGIPVKWEQISGARAIVEAGFRDISVDPSQGSHFFQNLTAFQVGYFSVGPRLRESFVDWKWLAEQKSAGDGAFTRHIRLDG